MKCIKKMITTILTVGMMSGFLSMTCLAADTAAKAETDMKSIMYEDTAKGIVDETIRSYLNLRSGSGMEYEVIGHLLPGDEVEVVGQEGEWYEITAPVKNGYVHSDYLCVTAVKQEAEVNPDTDLEPVSQALTPEGNMTLTDDIGTVSGSGQQFITLVTKNGNYFYLIIDRDDEGNENVHFLNMVDEADLFALMDEEQRKAFEADQEKEVIVEVPQEKETEVEPEPVIEEKESRINIVPAVLILLAMAGASGYYFYSQMDKKKKVDIKSDPDADYDENHNSDQLSEDDDIVILEDDEENESL